MGSSVARRRSVKATSNVHQVIQVELQSNLLKYLKDKELSTNLTSLHREQPKCLLKLLQFQCLHTRMLRTPVRLETQHLQSLQRLQWQTSAMQQSTHPK